MESLCREVVERRVYTVTGKQASEDEVERMIETGESETIFQKAILEQGRGHVSAQCLRMSSSNRLIFIMADCNTSKVECLHGHFRLNCSSCPAHYIC